jgi:hypothetical protein
MSWIFSQKAVLKELAGVIQDILARDTPQAVISISNTDGLQQHLPYIHLAFNGTSDSDSWIIDTGTLEVTVEDPDNPPAMITYETEYSDTIVNFSVSIVAVSNPKDLVNYETTNAAGLLRTIRKGLLLPKYRNRLKANVFSVVALGNNPIRPTPDLLAGQTQERYTLRFNMSSVDRSIDYDSGVFDKVNWIGTLYQVDDTDPDTNIITGSSDIVYQP